MAKGLASSLSIPFICVASHLAAHEGNKATTQFQKILDHRGVVLNGLIGALARIQVSHVLMFCKATPSKPAPRIGISSRSGKTLTLTFQSSSLRKRNTGSFNNQPNAQESFGDLAKSW